MAEPHDTTGSTWLTPTASGIAGLTIGILSLLGDGAWQVAIQGWLNRNGSSALCDTVMLSGVTQGVLAIGALVLARRALAVPLGTARHLGGATVVVGLLGLLVGVLTLLAGIAGAG